MGKCLQGDYEIPQIERGDYGVAMRVAAGDSQQKASLYQEHGLQLRSATEAQLYYLGFNWLVPVLGKGDKPEQQETNRKPRKAIRIAFDWEQLVTLYANAETRRKRAE